MGVPLLTIACGGCGVEHPTKLLPNASELGSPRGNRIIRVISHFHSPYSHDACDYNGLPGGTLNRECYDHMVSALCNNRVDFTFVTDHPDNMQNYEFSDMLQSGSSDEVLSSGSNAYAKRVGSCSNGFKPVVSLGFEAQMMALGMTQHLETSSGDRGAQYQKDTQAVALRLKNETDAVVAIPHTESKTVDWIQTVQADAIEIYNFHANIDPKIRKRDLNAKPFQNIAAFLTYLVDPFSQLVPDTGFVQFLETFSVYFTKWNQLIEKGVKVTGIAGSDSHENVFPQKVSDGERLDSHRRIVRLVSNHFLVSSSSPTLSDVKSSLRARRGWVVFEGLGSPVGMDFYVSAGASTVGVGETLALSGQTARIQVKLPTLHPDSPQGTDKPSITIALKRVRTGGEDEVVASTVDSDLTYETTTTGAYRAELKIVPRHLLKYLGDFANLASNTYTWIITNHVFLDP